MWSKVTGAHFEKGMLTLLLESGLKVRLGAPVVRELTVTKEGEATELWDPALGSEVRRITVALEGRPAEEEAPPHAWRAFIPEEVDDVGEKCRECDFVRQTLGKGFTLLFYCSHLGAPWEAIVNKECIDGNAPEWCSKKRRPQVECRGCDYLVQGEVDMRLEFSCGHPSAPLEDVVSKWFDGGGAPEWCPRRR